MADIQKLRNSARGLKSWYTRVETACEPYATGSKTGDKDIYTAKKRELTKAKDSLDTAMCELLLASNFVEDSTEEANHLKAVADLQGRYDLMMDNLAQKEAESQRTTTIRAEDPKRFVKPIFELRPKEFNSSSSIEEVEPFCKQFTAFFQQSNLDLCSNENAQQYLKNCLDIVLVQHLDTRIDSQTPVIGGGNSCLNYIREYFTQKHPLLTRRMNAFTLKQPSGVPFLDFYGKASQIYRSAEIEKLTSEELTSYLLITATTDKELKKEFLKLKSPDVKALLECARTHVRANQASDECEKIETFAVSQFSRSRTGNTSFRSKLRRLGITCGRCGNRSGHSDENCDRERDQLECFTCRDEGRPYIGHVSATCFDNLGIPRPRNNSGSQILPRERNRSGSGSRLQRRASTPGGYRENEVNQVEDGYLSDNFDFSDGVFQINEDFNAESNSTDEITSINIDNQIDQEPKGEPLPEDFDRVDPIELMDIPLLSMEVDLSTKHGNKIKVLANPDTGTFSSLLPLGVASQLGLNNLEHSGRTLEAANKTPISYQGDIRLQLNFKGNQIISSFAIADVSYTLVGRRDLYRLGLLKEFPMGKLELKKNRNTPSSVEMVNMMTETSCVLDFELPVPGKPCRCAATTHHFFNLFKATEGQMKRQLFEIYKDRIPTHVRLYIELKLLNQDPTADEESNKINQAEYSSPRLSKGDKPHDQELQPKPSGSGKLSFRKQLRRLGITCLRCGSHKHGESNCTKLKKHLNCSYCKERNRPSIGHVMETCYDKLGIRQPRTRSKSRNQRFQSPQRTSLSAIRKDNDKTQEPTQPLSSDTSTNTSMTSTKTGEMAQLTVDKPTTDTDTSHPSDKPALFPWTSLSQEKILHEIQKGIKNLTGPNKDSLKQLLPNVNTKVVEDTIANIPIDTASATKNASTAILTPFGCFPAIKATNNSIRTTTPSSPTNSDQPSFATKPASATAPVNVNQAIVNQASDTKEEDIWARALGVSVCNQDPTVSTTTTADPMDDTTKLDKDGRPYYDLEDLLEDSTSTTKTPEDATLTVAVVKENHLKDKEMRRTFWDGYEQGVEDKREQDSSSGSDSDNPSSIDSASDDRNETESHDGYEQGCSDEYYDGQDDAYNDYSDHQDDYYD